MRWLNSSAAASLRRSAAGDARNMPNRCTSKDADADIAAGPVWNGWSPDATNARFDPASGLPASDVPRLTLKWAFGFPGVSSSCTASPRWRAVACLSVSNIGYVYALDAATGCVHWSFLAETGVRNAISIGAASADASVGSASGARRVDMACVLPRHACERLCRRREHRRADLEGER